MCVRVFSKPSLVCANDDFSAPVTFFLVIPQHKQDFWCFYMMHLLNYADWKHWFTLCHCVAGVLFTETSERCAHFDGRTSSIFNEGLRGVEEAASVRLEEPKCTKLSWTGNDSSASCLSVLILREFTAHCRVLLCFGRLLLSRRCLSLPVSKKGRVPGSVFT